MEKDKGSQFISELAALLGKWDATIETNEDKDRRKLGRFVFKSSKFETQRMHVPRLDKCDDFMTGPG